MKALIQQGKLLRVEDEKSITATFKKREFVLETVEQYPQRILFELTQTNTNLLEKVNPGDLIDVCFYLRGREWQKDADSEVRVFNSLNAWKVDVVETNTTPEPIVKDKLKEVDNPDLEDMPF
jgi:hypothetical protein